MDLDTFQTRLTEWKNDALSKIKGSTPEIIESKAGEIQDQYETLLALCDGLTSVNELVTRIESLFSDEARAGQIVCSSVHKAKGKETDNVFVLFDTIKSSNVEEKNVHYVAISRAKKNLVKVHGLGKGEE